MYLDIAPIRLVKDTQFIMIILYGKYKQIWVYSR